MIARTLRGPHQLYRRYQASIESTLTSAGLAAVVVLSLQDLAVYPDNWVLVMGVAIGLVGIRWPLLAYVGAVATMLYPVFTINLYLAVLFLAVAALGQRTFVHYLGATVLVLATPLLARYHLHWLVPIMAGLWWGGMRGGWVGGLAALWGKILGGMAGLNIDWLVMAGGTPDTQAIAARFSGANSLDTLLLLVEPFAATSSVVLYNLLQVVGWAAAAGLVGSLAGRKWVKFHMPWSILVLTAGGGLILLATHLGLPYWLEEAVTGPALLVLQDPVGPLFSLLIVIIAGTTVHTLRESLDMPVAPPRLVSRPAGLEARRGGVEKKTGRSPVRLFQRLTRSGRQGQPAEAGPEAPADLDRLRRPMRVPLSSELPEWEPPKDESGLIMLEID